MWGNPADWEAEGQHWGALPAIRRAINRRVTGDPELTPLEWFCRGRAPFGRALVLGCGGGQLERDLIAAGRVREVLAVDLSPRVLAHAEQAARTAGLEGIRYAQADMNRLQLDEAPFDLVLGVSAVHHCAELDPLFAAVERLLAPGGWFYLDEYVGPNRFQWTEAQLAAVNRLLDLLPDDLVRTAGGRLRRNFLRVTPDQVAAVDPSEAVHSAEILATLGRRFQILERRGYGGAALHLVLAQVAQNFGDARAGLYLDRLIAAEVRLQQAGALGDDFAVIIARKLS